MPEHDFRFDLQTYLWARFWKFMSKDSHREACDTLRLLEGETKTLTGKVLPYKRKS